jgi:hypothetical protein
MTKLPIDLKKNPEVASLVADMEVGAAVRLETTIKSKDEQTLVLVLESATAGEATEDEDSEGDETDSEDESEPKSPAEKVATGMDDDEQ